VTQRTRVAVDGRPIVLSNLGKVLWPEVGYTKADLLAYYQSMEACLLPHWRGRFLTVTRYPPRGDRAVLLSEERPGRRTRVGEDQKSAGKRNTWWRTV